jgi:hypothetical protein
MHTELIRAQLTNGRVQVRPNSAADVRRMLFRVRQSRPEAGKRRLRCDVKICTPDWASLGRNKTVRECQHGNIENSSNLRPIRPVVVLLRSSAVVGRRLRPCMPLQWASRAHSALPAQNSKMCASFAKSVAGRRSRMELAIINATRLV